MIASVGLGAAGATRRATVGDDCLKRTLPVWGISDRIDLQSLIPMQKGKGL